MISTENDIANGKKRGHHTILILFFFLLFLGIGVISGFRWYNGRTQHRVAIPTSGNLCGTTNGRGQIVSIGSNTITIKLDNGTDQIIDISSQATIKTPTSSGSISDLKTGDRVTIVGSPNPDGSENATDVLVCGVIQ